MRLRALFRRKRIERELDEELRFHIERQAELYVSQGLPAGEAFRRARLEFGAIDAVKEECREAHGLILLETLLQDLRYAGRVLCKSPGFALVAVLSLALGIGANTAIFSLMDGALWKALPVKDPERLVQAFTRFNASRAGAGLPPEAYDEMRHSREPFSGLCAFNWTQVSFRAGDGAAERVMALGATGEYFVTLGVPALLGRTFRAQEDSPAAVLSYSFWERRFGRDPAVIGQTVYVDGAPLTVVGVMPPEFVGTDRTTPTDITVPLTERYVHSWLLVWARLKPGVTFGQAQGSFAAVFAHYLERIRPELAHWPARNRAARLAERGELRPAAKGAPEVQFVFQHPLRILLAFTAVVLLIACANVANLLLARAAARANEIGLRLAIGADRQRLVRQLLTESLLLSSLGAAAAILIAFWGQRLLLVLMVGDNGLAALEFHLDLRVLAFLSAIALFTGVLFGILPAVRTTGVDLSAALRRDSHHGGALRHRLARSLVVVQVAASVVLLVGAGLFARTLANLRALDPGFKNPESMLVMTIDPRAARPEPAQRAPLYGEIARHVESLPGVRGASLAANILFGRGSWWKTVFVEGRSRNDTEQAGSNYVGPKFFATAGVPLLAGREFTSRDGPGAPEVVIINAALARRFWPGQSPIGKHVGTSAQPGKWEIVGVVGDTKYGGLRDTAPPMEYHALAQDDRRDEVILHVRTIGAPALMAARIRQEIAAIDKGLTVYDVKTMAAEVDRTLRREHMFAALSAFFGLLALALTCIGIYGVISYAVARRTNEIGVRIALGAARGAVVWMVLRETLLLLAAGATAGVPAALALTRLIRSLLFGLTPNDPATVAGAVLALAAVGALAGYLPARRAAGLDPTSALRYE